tara:strand:+ start:4508 stop:4858 length:351 start_codon:yes stop_codon:yes gene_type:complete
MILEKVFKVEEHHRGEWKPLIIKGTDKQKTVKITQDQADRNNVYADDYKIRYVEVSEKPKKQKKDKKEKVVSEKEYTDLEASAIRDEYIDLFGKKPFGGWSTDVLEQKIEEFKKQS